MSDQPGIDPTQPIPAEESGGNRGWLWALAAVVVVLLGVIVWLLLRGDGTSSAEASASPSSSVSDSPSESASTSAAPSPTETTETSSPSPTASETTVPGDFGTDPVTSEMWPELGQDLGTGVAVRVGHHDGYDRVVYEFAKAGVPQYQVQYTDNPIAEGSGDPVEVKGATFLEVVVTSVGVPEGSAPSPTAPSLSGTIFAQVDPVYGGFEGYGKSYIGIDDVTRHPFSVSVEQNPTRLVIDVLN